MKSLVIPLVVALSLVATPLLAAPPDAPYHVMWTNAKGKEKCCNKKTQAKADEHAAKLRAKGKVTNVQVMAGSCSSMR